MIAMNSWNMMRINFDFPPSVPKVKKRLQKYSKEMSDTSKTYTKLVDPKYSPPRMVDPKYWPCRMVDPNYRPSGMVDPKYRLSWMVNPSYSPFSMVDPNYRPSRMFDPSYRPSRMVDPSYRPSWMGDPSYRPSRMVDPNYPQSRTRDESDNRRRCTSINLPIVKLPGKDDINMLGFESVGHRVRSQCGHIPPAMDTATQKQQRQMLGERAMNVLEENKTHQLPLSTLSVRWQLKPTLPGYNSSYLHQLFSEHGKVKKLWITSPNSAMVVFREMSVACNVVNLRFLGKQLNRLQCRLYHRDMENKQLVAHLGRA